MDNPAPARGWTFAGFIPFGIFAFAHRQVTWGVIGALGVIPLLGLIPGLVYAVYIGRHGRRLAWESGLCRDELHLRQAMQAWNTVGLVALAVGVLAVGPLILISGYDIVMSWIFNGFVPPMS